MEVTFRFPSSVPYGDVIVRQELDPGTSMEALGEMYAQGIYDFRRGQDAAVARIRAQEASGAPQGPAGGKVDQESTEDEESVLRATEALQSGLGATVIEKDGKPWEKKVTPKTKPWENDNDADFGDF